MKSRIKDFIKKAFFFIFNPRLQLCMGIAWFITNGWSYVMVALGTWLDITWMKAVGGGYVAFLWLPVSPEKIITVSIAIFLLRLIFPNDQKTLAVLREMKEKAKSKIKRKRRSKTMPIKAILFDLDGTLLPMDQDIFVKAYFSRIAEHMVPYGYEPKELIGAIWSGTAAMVKNDFSRTNEEVFWEACKAVYGDKVIEDIPHFDEFYVSKFDTVSEVCGRNTRAAELIAELKRQGFRLILATNPLFPPVATMSRIRWAGLNPEDFEYISHYENSRSCKPSLSYYKDILEKAELEPTDCLMIGNDVADDMVVTELGMKVFLLTDCLINKNNADISVYPHGSFDDLTEYIRKLDTKEN